MIQPEVIELDRLMRLCGVTPGKAAERSGVSESNWRRWRLGVVPSLDRFRKFRVAVIDIAVERGILEVGCHSLAMVLLIDMAGSEVVG